MMDFGLHICYCYFSFLFLCSDIHSALVTVAEGVANMLAPTLHMLARAFAEARLAALQSAVRTAPKMARWDVVRGAPLSRGLFDQGATDQVITSIPTVIQIQAPQQPQ